MTPEALLKYYKSLAKNGEAEFAVIFTASPEDEDFKDHPPVAIVTVVATNPETGATITKSSQVSPGSAQFLVTIPILSVPNVLKATFNRLRGRPKTQPFSVSIMVTPIDKWNDFYSATTFAATVSLGANGPQHVWLNMKKQRHGAFVLDKPKRPPSA
jgi:hypothetical protein